MRIVLLFLVLLATTSARAVGFAGRFKLDANYYDAGADTPEAAVGYQTSSDLTAQLRLELNQGFGPWDFEAAWELEARHGSAVKREAAVAAAFPSSNINVGENNYWDLEDELVDSNSTQSSHRLDRLSLAYTQPEYVVRVGRQALTWGTGLVFHPMDLVNPFEPVANDTAYKRGTDMAYGQWLLPDGSDIQLALVPHKQRDVTDPDADKGTYALYANLAGASLQWNLLLAQDRADTVLGVGASGPLGGAVWNLELIPTYLQNDSIKTSALVNISYSGTLLNRNITSFAEYYHNGFGEPDSGYSVTQLSPDLLVRLQRGQLFVTARDYLTLGTTWEWTPLLQLIPTLIFNLRDQSALFDTQINWSLSDDTALKAGLRLPFGARGTEFGGLELVPDAQLYLARSTQAFVRLEAYF
jgi:hypothetical protein